jgi:alpha-2-macroglobulin
MRFSRGWFVLLLVGLFPLAALSDSPPQVSMATPGSGGTNGGAIDRYTIRFSESMVPLGDPRAAAPVAVTCPVGGTGRWVDTQTFVYEFQSPLPGGLTCEVKLRDRLKSARGADVTGTSLFKIDTGGPSARAVLGGSGSGDIEEDQVFLVATNVTATPASVSANGYCAVDGIGEKIALDVLGASTVTKIVEGVGPDNWQLRNFLEQAGLPDRPAGLKLPTVMAVKCRRPLPPGHDMSIVWTKAIAAADGRLAGRDQRFDFSVREAFSAKFECSRVNPQSGCNPLEPAYVRLTADVPVAQAMAMRITLADGSVRSPKAADKTKAVTSDIEFSGPFPSAVKGTVSLPSNLADESGRTLTNAARFPLEVRFDEAPPLVKFAAPFGIIEANEGGLLPVTVRAVEPQLAQRVSGVTGDMLRVDASDGAVAKWLRDLDDADDSDFRDVKQGKETVSVNYTGSKSLLAGQGSELKLGLPGKGKDFEVVGIPLRKPGFYVVELASPLLGQSLLGRTATRYVAAGALVTNLGVHFKWGREKSLAWVTTLDGARPVADADVRVTDSCSGKLLARGTSDAQGRLLIPAGLPSPETYGGCAHDDESHPLMVSARRNGDFSFTLTAWGEGIRPFDFDLPYGYSDAHDIVHTVFDRTLVRTGETINMKHILRRPVGDGFAYGQALSGTLTLSHSGSGTSYDLPVTIGKDGIGETSWTVPQGAPQGDYNLSITAPGMKEHLSSYQSFRVDEYRLPTMRATITGPKDVLIRPKSVPLDLFVGYLSGGGAAAMPVSVRTAFAANEATPDGWDGWTFGGRPVVAGTVPLNGDGAEDVTPLPNAQTLPLTLGQDGTGKTSVDVGLPITDDTAMTVEMDYQDANGETLTASRVVQLYASAIHLGLKTDGWLMRDSDLRLKIATIDAEGHAMRGQSVSVDVYSRETLTARRRLIGGFYAYDNQSRTTKVAGGCATTTDSQGLASCKLDPGVSGEVIVVATATDSSGNVARAVKTVWLAGEDEWWFGGDNGDRMDLIPEAKSYKAGETARFQVRMPYRNATALVTVEREDVLSSFVTQLSGKDPVVEVAMPGAYAPDVYVSVMAVRGRVGGFRLWLATLARDWHLPFFNREGAEPTALVDLAKPSYRIGIAKVKVGWEGHQLAVTVKADKLRYTVRDNATVDVAVTSPGGKPPASAEIAFAAVDQSLLQLSPNDSWQLIDAMMGERPLSVLTSTAQTQVVGKRHYGKKAVEAGGGGGDATAVTRDDFRPVLLWKGRVVLDASGHARLTVPLSDSLSAFKLVAIASSGSSLFGTGETDIRTAQDLTIYSGLPPLVRTGDFYGASFTLRNGSDKAMTVNASVKVSPGIAHGPSLQVTIPAGGAVPVTWNMPAPAGIPRLDWTVEAKSADSKAADRIAVSQEVIPVVPVEVWAATTTNAGAGKSIPLMAPAGSLPGYGFVDVKLSNTLAPPLGGVRAFMAAYPYSCFEQSLSRSVALGDDAEWTKLAGAIPSYMDRDGLLRYFPSDNLSGSADLTAYVLSMTAEAGYAIPDAAKARLLEAMKAVVDGRLKRETAWAADNRLTRLAALAALARNGAATPQMLGQIGMAPADMPTTSLADWMTAINRTRGANPALRVEAEKIMRQRIAYEGSRLDMTDQDTAPWWMMASRDESAIKALLAVLGRPGWEEDGPKMMIGVAARQLRGHWDLTNANAWGAIATRRFAALFPATAINGVTTATLGSQTLTRAWPQASDAAPLRFTLPFTQSPLLIRQSAGSAGPWANVSVSAAVPLRAPLFAGYKLDRKVSVISQRNKDHLTRGDVIKITLTIDANAERNWVVVNDPVPPGATIIGNLGGQSAILGAQANGGDHSALLAGDSHGKLVGVEFGVHPAYVERRNDGWRGYFEWVPRGRFVTEYAVRLNGTGRFNLPPTRVEAMYSPDIRAQWPNQTMTVAMR